MSFVSFLIAQKLLHKFIEKKKRCQFHLFSWLYAIIILYDSSRPSVSVYLFIYLSPSRLWFELIFITRLYARNVALTCTNHRYLMTRLSLQVVYPWRHVSWTATPFILWWSNLEILFGPLHRSSSLIGELHCQAIQTEHGPYIAERAQKAVYIVRCLWC
jgi:hypothetical protein